MTMKRDVLIVDDDARIRASLAEALSRSGTTVRTAADASSALRCLAESPADIILADVRMPGMDGLELLRLLRERAPQVAVVIMTAYDDLPTAASAMREGAADFLVKPLDLHQLRGVIDKVFEDRAARAAAVRVPPPDATDQSCELIGHDPRMVGIFKTIGQVSAARTNVVIRGESGTGKELIARAIHLNSPCAHEPFVPVSCTALPTTLLESELFGHTPTHWPAEVYLLGGPSYEEPRQPHLGYDCRPRVRGFSLVDAPCSRSARMTARRPRMSSS